MRKDFWVASDRPVFKTPLFRLSLLLPITIGSLLAMYIGKAESLIFSLSEGAKSAELFWHYLKVPIAIASLSIPLTSWVIANHRSAQLVETINKQEEKRFHDLFYDHSNYFVKIFGRLIKTHKWSYLEEDDLPLIHRQLFFHNILKNSGKFEPNPIVLDSIKLYLRNMADSFNHFVDGFDSLSAEGKNEALDSHCWNFTVFARDRLMTLVKNLGSRPIFPDDSLQSSLSATIEVASLYKWVIPEYETEDDFVDVEELKVSEVCRLIMTHFDISRPEDFKPSIIEGYLIISELKSMQPEIVDK